jgi:hypothetical protein
VNKWTDGLTEEGQVDIEKEGLREVRKEGRTEENEDGFSFILFFSLFSYILFIAFPCRSCERGRV